MIDIKKLCLILTGIIYIYYIITLISADLSKLLTLLYYDNNDIILINDINAYKFTFIKLILNIITSLFLFWLIFDKYNINIINCIILLFIINFLIGIWCITLYKNINIIRKLGNVIIIEYNIFIIENSLFALLFIYIFCVYFYKKIKKSDILDNDTNIYQELNI